MGFFKNRKPNTNRYYTLKKAINLVGEYPGYVVKQNPNGKYQLVSNEVDREEMSNYQKRRKAFYQGLKYETSASNIGINGSNYQGVRTPYDLEL